MDRCKTNIKYRFAIDYDVNAPQFASTERTMFHRTFISLVFFPLILIEVKVYALDAIQMHGTNFLFSIDRCVCVFSVLTG